MDICTPGARTACSSAASATRRPFFSLSPSVPIGSLSAAGVDSPGLPNRAGGLRPRAHRRAEPGRLRLRVRLRRVVPALRRAGNGRSLVAADSRGNRLFLQQRNQSRAAGRGGELHAGAGRRRRALLVGKRPKRRRNALSVAQGSLGNEDQADHLEPVKSSFKSQLGRVIDVSPFPLL